LQIEQSFPGYLIGIGLYVMLIATDIKSSGFSFGWQWAAIASIAFDKNNLYFYSSMLVSVVAARAELPW
jgi:hypothetical protein